MSGVRSSHEEVQRIQSVIEKQRVRRRSNKVLHGHPSPVFWPERDVPIDEILVQRKKAKGPLQKRLNLYVGTPYCIATHPRNCGFCLFPSDTYRNSAQLDTYLQLLLQEAGVYAGHFEHDELSNVYFGGGTSNLHKPHHYEQLLSAVHSLFPQMSPSVEITLEGIPQLFSEEKLQAMKEAGVTRISMGVQQLSDELIRFSGRKQSREQVFRTLDICRALGLPASVALIFGWPQQTAEQMLADLDAILSTGISHITHYELNVAGRTNFARHRRHELPSTEQNLELYRISRDFLRSRGYRQITAYDWKKDDPAPTGHCRYEEEWHSPFTTSQSGISGIDALGLGFAGISFMFGTPGDPGWAYMNSTDMDEYARAVMDGRLPIERGFRYTPVDLRLTTLFRCCRQWRLTSRTIKPFSALTR